MRARQKTVIGIGVVLIIVVVSVLVWVVWQNAARQEQDAKREQAAQSLDKSRLIADINKRYGKKDYDGAISLIESQKLVQDADMQVLLASAYANKGDMQKALSIYQALDTAGTLPKTELANVAIVAERAKNYKQAIELYKRAKAELQKAGSSDSQDQIAVYDYKITQLEKAK